MEESSSPYRKLAPSITKSKNSSISSDSNNSATAAAGIAPGSGSSSIAPSSRYTFEHDQHHNEYDVEHTTGLDDEAEGPSSSNIIKRPSMYHSDMSQNNRSTISRRQNLLKRRSQQLLGQLDENAGGVNNTTTTGSISSNNGSPAPVTKFVVTNPDPVVDPESPLPAQSRLQHQHQHQHQQEPSPQGSSESDEDLNKFVNLMKTKDAKFFSPDDIKQLKTLSAKPSIPGNNRMSTMSQYSGVVEEVAEVQHILPERSSYIPSLVEMASHTNKRGNENGSNSGGSNSSSTSGRIVSHKKSKSFANAETDMESLRSMDSSSNLGPLPTTTVLAATAAQSKAQTPDAQDIITTTTNNDDLTNIRPPDVSQLTELDPTIPPRSSRRPRSAILSAPSSNPASPGSGSTTSLAGATTAAKSPLATPTKLKRNNSSSIKRHSMPPPSSQAPLTPTQLQEKRISGTFTKKIPTLDYAKMLNKNISEDVLQDRKRISSANKPLPAPPASNEEEDEDEDDDEDRGQQENEGIVDVNDLMNELRQDSSIRDQESERVLDIASSGTGNVPGSKSIISDETTVEKDLNPMEADTTTTTFRIHSIGGTIEEVSESPNPMQSEEIQEFGVPKMTGADVGEDVGVSITPTSTPSEKRIQFAEQTPEDHEEEGVHEHQQRQGKVTSDGKNRSLTTLDNASFYTADSYTNNTPDVIKTDDMSKFDNDDNYEDIEVVSSGKKQHSHDNKRKHKKKTSSTSTSNNNNKLRPFSISTLSKLLESTDGVIIGEEFDNLDIPNDDKKYIEKIVDVIARLTTDMITDSSRHEGTINRMKAALRILEGFE